MSISFGTATSFYCPRCYQTIVVAIDAAMEEIGVEQPPLDDGGFAKLLSIEGMGIGTEADVLERFGLMEPVSSNIPGEE